MTARIIQNEWAAHHIDLRIFSNFKFLDQSGYILFDVSLANSCCELFRIYWLTPKIIPSLWSVNSKLHIAQRCILPVYFPLDLLLLNILVNAQERKLAKRISVCIGGIGTTKNSWFTKSFFHKMLPISFFCLIKKWANYSKLSTAPSITLFRTRLKKVLNRNTYKKESRQNLVKKKIS